MTHERISAGAFPLVPGTTQALGMCLLAGGCIQAQRRIDLGRGGQPMRRAGGPPKAASATSQRIFRSYI